ncbi:hypothetical protein BD289DRAFT_368568 [Coniella lustricola]|uniref:3-beta hydroxysteroid dehydrogenase/isomerase domain-containing protein n=1 Tax=Coniella lustricola TaxID=2025994 RepID=A0A2T3A7Q6_9PEZI|nr:hypothetical protein BD289DRAFT_368568 [Coniella lustricola]
MARILPSYTEPYNIAVAVFHLLSLFLIIYLVNLNRLLNSTPPEVQKLVPRRWTQAEIKNTYNRLCKDPITTASYKAELPPRLQRRYVVTGGSGLLGGYIVLQLLERGQPPNTIRIVDFQTPHRSDLLCGPGKLVPFYKADISSAASTEAAFDAPWDKSVADLPLTVFHTAAVIIPSARSPLVNAFCEAVNVHGTAHVLASARNAGADVFISTSSASIAVQPVEFWAAPWKWRHHPQNSAQILDESDFFRPLQAHDEFWGNYPASKAKAERMVCNANAKELRTGCIRPANGVYGHPSDNLLGAPLSMQIYPQWVRNNVQSFVHGVNCALAHLQLEAVLAKPDSYTAPQAGRPFCITDPNPPIYYGDLHNVLSMLARTPFRIVTIPPVLMLLLSYAVEFYNLLPLRVPFLAGSLPRLPGGLVYLEPGLFTICTHLVGNMNEACKPVEQGGLGYRGVLTTLEGMCQELVDWNREQEEHAKEGLKAHYRSSVFLAEEIRKGGGTLIAVGT